MAVQVGAFALQKTNNIQFKMYPGPPQPKPRPRAQEDSPAEQPAQRVIDSGMYLRKRLRHGLDMIVRTPIKPITALYRFTRR